MLHTENEHNNNSYAGRVFIFALRAHRLLLLWARARATEMRIRLWTPPCARSYHLGYHTSARGHNKSIGPTACACGSLIKCRPSLCSGARRAARLGERVYAARAAKCTKLQTEKSLVHLRTPRGLATAELSGSPPREQIKSRPGECALGP